MGSLGIGVRVQRLRHSQYVHVTNRFTVTHQIRRFSHGLGERVFKPLFKRDCLRPAV